MYKKQLSTSTIYRDYENIGIWITKLDFHPAQDPMPALLIKMARISPPEGVVYALSFLASVSAEPSSKPTS